MVLKEVILTISTWGEEVVVLKELILTISTLGGGYGGLERFDFNSFYFGEEVVVLKGLILTVSTLGRKWWF